MANEVFDQLDTSQVANGFNDFLESQGLGDMNPSSASRFRDGVAVSPMDEILALNGFDLDSLFKKKLPELPPLNSLGNGISEAADNTEAVNEQIRNTKAAIQSLGLSDEELVTLGNLLESGGSTSVGALPAQIIELIRNNRGAANIEDLLFQLGELQRLIGTQQLPEGKDIAQVMLTLMAALKTNDSRFLLSFIEKNPHALKDALRDSVTGILSPLEGTTSLLRGSTAFDSDPIIGTMADETLIAYRSGGSSLAGIGGSDIYVIALRSTPFAPKTIIKDFNVQNGSKIAIDTTDYEGVVRPTFRLASNRKMLNRFTTSKTGFIYNNSTSELMFNANGKKDGFGENGGVVAFFENSAEFDKNSLFVFNGQFLFGVS